MMDERASLTPSFDQLLAFVFSADEGSFSAAARKLRKAQSAVSTAVINLETDLNVELFDRSTRNPTLTEAGESLLSYARSVLLSSDEFAAHAMSIGEGVETHLSIAIERGLLVHSLLPVFAELTHQFPSVEIELMDPIASDVPKLLKLGRADLGVMIEQEDYPKGFQFRGIGHSHIVPVCGREHPLAKVASVSHRELRRYRQLVCRRRGLNQADNLRDQKSPNSWYCESPQFAMELMGSGIGWAELPMALIEEELTSGKLVQLQYSFQQTEIMQGVDVVWTEQRALGAVGQWLREKLMLEGSRLWPR